MIVRRALPIDNDRILELMSSAGRTIIQMPWGELGRLVPGAREPEPNDLFLGEDGGRLLCVWGSAVESETVAHIRLFGVRDDWCLNQGLVVLLTAIQESLYERGARTLAFVGLEGWFLDVLLTNGFRRVNTVVTMQKGDFAIPDAGHEHVVVRSAVHHDFPAILAIEEAAFDPLWRNTIDGLAHYRAASAYLVVAQLADLVVGYTIGSLVGRHAHLTRIAVCPTHQGQRIGVRLLAEAIRFFREQSVFGITLNTQQDNAKARRLYRWFGFRALGREADVLVRDLDVWLAHSTLARPVKVKYNE